jgi:hypothetical protein
VSRLRARCPDCGTLTAVALGPEYQCHSCGREFGAALVRVPRAWGAGGDAMGDAAWLSLPYPEASVVDEETLGLQSLALAAELPDRPIVLGGCCCAHIGAVEGLAARHDDLAVVWIDAHGDLNTPQTSPSGNTWGMPLRMIIDADLVEPRHIAHVGARNLDPPEAAYIAEHGVQTGPDAIARALDGMEAVYVALDVDAIDPPEIGCFMPEPNGLSLQQVESLLRDIAGRLPVVGVGFTGLLRDPANEPKLERFCVALGL